MQFINSSFTANAGGTSQKLAIGPASAQTAVAPPNCTAFIVTPDTTCFFRMGLNPVALADGTDQILLANQQYRIGIAPGYKLAFITTASAGNIYNTPEI
jgi:hypothetical protein